MASSSAARSAPDERPGGRSGYQASSPKQPTAKFRSTADSAHLEIAIGSVPRPRRWESHAGAVGAASAAGNGAFSQATRAIGRPLDGPLQSQNPLFLETFWKLVA